MDLDLPDGIYGNGIWLKAIGSHADNPFEEQERRSKMADHKKAKGVLPQGGPAPEDLVRAARGDFEPLYREAQTEIRRLRVRIAGMRVVLANLIFTATKLWDDAKPIKDTKSMTATHPIIEQAKRILLSTAED